MNRKKFDPAYYYKNIDSKLKLMASELYTEEELKLLGCEKTDRHYLLQSRKEGEEGFNSCIDLVFDYKRKEGKWGVTDACKSVILFSEINIDLGDYLENIIQRLPVGSILKDSDVQKLKRARDIHLNNGNGNRKY